MTSRGVLDALLGVYSGLMLVSAATVAGWEVGAAALPVGLLLAVGVGIAAVVAGAAHRVEDLVDSVVTVEATAVLVGLPLLYLPLLIFVLEPTSGSTVFALAGLLAIVPGACVSFGGALIRNQQRREQATEVLTVTVGDEDGDGSWLPEASKNWIAAVGVAFVGVGLVMVGIAVTIGFDGSSTTVITSLTGAATSLLVFADDSSEVTVTDSGLKIDQQFIDWAEFEGYRVTDKSVELVRPKWYQGTHEFDREEINDDEALIEGLGTFLPRLDEHGRVERSPSRPRQ